MTEFRTIRAQLGLTQVELGMRLGIHQTSISRMETGDLPLDPRTRLALDALLLRMPSKDRRRADLPSHGDIEQKGATA